LALLWKLVRASAATEVEDAVRAAMRTTGLDQTDAVVISAVVERVGVALTHAAGALAGVAAAAPHRTAALAAVGEAIARARGDCVAMAALAPSPAADAVTALKLAAAAAQPSRADAVSAGATEVALQFRSICHFDSGTSRSVTANVYAPRLALLFRALALLWPLVRGGAAAAEVEVAVRAALRTAGLDQANQDVIRAMVERLGDALTQTAGALAGVAAAAPHRATALAAVDEAIERARGDCVAMAAGKADSIKEKAAADQIAAEEARSAAAAASLRGRGQRRANPPGS
jgi:molybdopterin synthase catalytic subunit